MLDAESARTDETVVEYVVEMDGVQKRFGATKALQAAELRIRRDTVHALVGRNGAGKSTLVGVLTGMVEPDEGGVLVEGRQLTASQRLRNDEIACVYQKPQILDHLTVAENLFIGKWDQAWVGRRDLYRKAENVLQQWGIQVDARLLAKQLDVEQRQLVEIGRALIGGPSLVILDEPTAQLDRHASERLFQRLEALKAQGVSFLFISHHLDEVFRVCDEVTVMRDGQSVASAVDAAALNENALVELMVGDVPGSAAPGESRERHDAPERIARETLLEVTELRSPSGAFRDISFELRAGEILGLTGLGGSGKREVGEALVGLHSREGVVRVDGRDVQANRVNAGIDAGIGFVPGDRHAAGFAPYLSNADNMTTSIFGRLGTLGWIRESRKNEIADALIRDLDIAPPRRRLATGGLSGGNQQKVVIGRALAGSPRVLVCIAPTAGVDVASKAFLYARLERAAEEGTAVLIVSDELDELAITDRVLVMFDGCLTAEFSRGWSPSQLIGAIEGVTGESAPAPHESTEESR